VFDWFYTRALIAYMSSVTLAAFMEPVY